MSEQLSAEHNTSSYTANVVFTSQKIKKKSIFKRTIQKLSKVLHIKQKQELYQYSKQQHDTDVDVNGKQNDNNSHEVPSEIIMDASFKQNEELSENLENVKEEKKKLEVKRQTLEKRALNELKKASMFKQQNNKQFAVVHLKKKKNIDNQIKHVDDLIMRMDEQIYNLENTETVIDTYKVLQETNITGKMVMNQLVRDDTVGLMEDMEEINDMLSFVNDQFKRTTAFDMTMDDDELLKEFNDLDEIEEMQKSSELRVDDIVDLPNPPNDSQDEEERHLSKDEKIIENKKQTDESQEDNHLLILA